VEQRERPVRTAGVPLAEKVAFLRRPGSYAHQPAAVEAIETHMAWVFLADGEAFKLKKPVRYAFLDFASLGARLRACREEVRLNRRLAGDVYRGVVPLVRLPGAGLAVGGAGETVDWLVHMRRLRRGDFLDARLAAAGVTAEEVRRVVQRLVGFYREAHPVPITPGAYRQRFRQDIRENRHEILELGELLRADLPEEAVEELARGQLAFLDAAAPLFDARVAAGRVVDGHGDLRPEHVCLEAEPVIIDCIEFNSDFRIVDPLDEIAYLAVECARLGAPATGKAFPAAYRELSGDDPPEALTAFYGSFRAFLRARIAIWHTRDGEILHPDHWVERTGDYLRLALERLPRA
jgi:aminoglycoside phosphotransferase family enzyme